MNFTSILSLSTEELQNLSNQQIVDCVQAALNDDGDTCSVFEFAFTRFTSILSLIEINEFIFRQILPILRKSFDDAIVEELPDVIQTILQLFMELSQSVHEKFDEIIVFCITDIHLILTNTLHFLCKTISHTFLYSHDPINKLLNMMQESINKILVSPKFEPNVTVDELKNGRSVLQGLVELGYQQSQRDDLKSMANTWKHVSKFAMAFHPIYRSLHEQNLLDIDESEGDPLDWIAFYVQILCNLITCNVDKAVNPNFKEKKQNVTKLANFYVKLLDNLAKEYANEDFRGQSHFIKLYQMIDNISEKCDDDDVKNHLLTLITGLSSILSNVFNCDRFSNELLENYTGDHMRVCLEVTKLLIQSSITSSDWYLNHENLHRNILYHLLFDCISKEMHQLYRFSHLYDKLLVLCTMLMVTTMNQQTDISLEYILVEATLMDDAVFHIPIILDIWTQFLRYVSKETLLLYCKLWMSISRNFSAMPRNPSCVIVQKLLKHTLNLVSESERSQILCDQTQDDLPPLPLLCFDGIADVQATKLQRYAQETINKIKQTMNKLNPKSEIVSSNECNELMAAFSNFQQPASPHLLSILNDASLTSSLIDALSRSKTRNVQILLSSVIKILLWQKYLCKNSTVEIDYSDSSEVQKFYVLELIALAQWSTNASMELSEFEGTDDLTQVRMRRLIENGTQNGNSQCQMSISTTESLEYVQQILQVNREFGCASHESCLNQSAWIKRSIDQIILEAQKLEHSTKTEPNVNLEQFSDEITYLADLFTRLKNQI
ncbi:uncharacterized protein LOC116337773 [Contarinia nasturtii]|uniref:uncharacterized protein LOC116337773 n=1 Tax=Contarinia nasturtii TaxID=265458 RepID=UPI0012D47C0C|nr:uncharacterized protein LOC116337773 [Contarinia nasturtii]